MTFDDAVAPHQIDPAPEQVYVEIVEHEGDRVEKRMGPMSRYKAGKVERGAEINLDHEHYFVRIVEE
jgi:hypothetical protein